MEIQSLNQVIMQDKFNDKMNNFGLKPSDSVWQGVERELKKNKRRPAAWWWTGLLLLLVPGILLVDNLNHKWETKTGAADVEANEQYNPGERDPESPLHSGSAAVSNDSTAFNKNDSVAVIEQIPALTPTLPEKTTSQLSPLAAIINSPTEKEQHRNISPQAPEAIPYKDLKNTRVEAAENRMPPMVNNQEDYLPKMFTDQRFLKRAAIAVPGMVKAPQFALQSDRNPFPPSANVSRKDYKDQKNRRNSNIKKSMLYGDDRWRFGLTASALIMNQGNFLEGLSANKSMMDYNSAPANAVGQPFTQTGYALDRAQRFGLGAVVNFQATKRLYLVTGMEVQRRINSITKTTMAGYLSSSGSYAFTQTGRQQLNSNAWSVDLPLGMGINFGKHFNLGVQMNNAVIFDGSDSLKSFTKANNLIGYQPAVAIAPTFIIGKKLNWWLSPQLETGLKKSATGKYNNGVGLRVSYFPVKKK